MKLKIVLFMLLLSSFGHAQQLRVNRPANLRETSSGTGTVLLKLMPGDTLNLVDHAVINGYRHISTKAGVSGWVYKSMVAFTPATRESFAAHTVHSFAQNVEVRVLDVGAGLCTLVKFPDNKYLIYDAGGDYTTDGTRTLNQIKTFIPAGSEIELMVLSHTDADHIVAAGAVIKNYQVKKLLWGGYDRSMAGADAPTAAYNKIISALKDHDNTENVNLNQRDSVIVPGNNFMIGNAKITFLCGFGKPLAEWGLTDKAEKLNAVSIIMRIDYSGNSVLFCGDAVGRHRDDPDDALIATEKFVVEKAAALLPSTVIIAPHHGAKNGSSSAFVSLVKAKAVIFSAGHKFHHPETITAERYLRFTPLAQIFRTDRGDDEGGTEWDYLRVPGTTDGYNDDNIDVLLKSDHTYSVNYLNH